MSLKRVAEQRGVAGLECDVVTVADPPRGIARAARPRAARLSGARIRARLLRVDVDERDRIERLPLERALEQRHRIGYGTALLHERRECHACTERRRAVAGRVRFGDELAERCFDLPVCAEPDLQLEVCELQLTRADGSRSEPVSR